MPERRQNSPRALGLPLRTETAGAPQDGTAKRRHRGSPWPSHTSAQLLPQHGWGPGAVCPGRPMPFKVCPMCQSQTKSTSTWRAAPPSMRRTVKPHDKGHGPGKVKTEVTDGTNHISVGRVVAKEGLSYSAGESMH